MKTYLISFAFIMCSLGLFAQDDSNHLDLKIGDILEIGVPETSDFQYIDIPRPNIIRKRGGIPNQKDLYGSHVVVTSVKEKSDGLVTVTFESKNGTRFFGSHKFMSANINEALQAGELKRMN